MIYLLMFNLTLFFISLLMFFMYYLMSKKSFMNQEKSSPFECGFDPLNNNRIPFSIHFFLISLIFLIFDIEIALLIPLIYMFLNFEMIMMISYLIFLTILIIGLYIEFSYQSIEWKK